MQNVPDDIAEQIGNLINALDPTVDRTAEQQTAAERAATKAGFRLLGLALGDVRAIADYARSRYLPSDQDIIDKLDRG